MHIRTHEFFTVAFAKLRRSSRFLPVTVVVVAIGLLGLYTLEGSHAATPVTSIEAEAGSRSGGASLVTDATASSSAAIKFTVNTSGTPHAGTKIAYIGDSLTWQNGQGQNLIQSALQAVGWPASGSNNYFYYGCEGKRIDYQDGCSGNPTTIQNIQAARSQLGSEPDVWVIALATNDEGNGAENWQWQFSDVLTALGTGARLLWVNDGTQLRSGGNVNAYMASALNGRPHTLIADWATYILTHDASGATVANNSATAIINNNSLWTDGVHMTTAGWNIRDAFVAGQTLQVMALP